MRTLTITATIRCTSNLISPHDRKNMNSICCIRTTFYILSVACHKGNHIRLFRATYMVDNTTYSSNLPKRLGLNIAQRRKQIGWTQANLAERMKMEPESISRFERGATLPSLATLELLAGELNVTVADLLAECSDSAYSEAQRISGWLSKLQPDARKIVLDGLQKLCVLLSRP